MPKISVIVAVYNAEKYIRRCVDSLLNQTFADFEILLINDGSKDKSGEICDDYAKKDNRVKVFHKENGGVSHTRQYGIEKALGEYTIHADPDDYVESTYLEDLYKEAENTDADMVICDFDNQERLATTYMKQEPTSLQPDSVLHDLFAGRIWGAMWNKLIKKSCYDNYNIKFPENVNLWEDLFVCCSILKQNIKVAYLPKALYHYDNIMNEGSLVRKISLKSVYWQDYFIKHFAEDMTREELYAKKALTLQRAFAGKVMSANELRNLYPEINNEYIANHKCDVKHPESLACSLILRSYPEKMVYLLNDIANYFVILFRKLRTKLKK